MTEEEEEKGEEKGKEGRIMIPLEKNASKFAFFIINVIIDEADRLIEKFTSRM